jgi:hypothetical protein
MTVNKMAREKRWLVGVREVSCMVLISLISGMPHSTGSFRPYNDSARSAAGEGQILSDLLGAYFFDIRMQSSEDLGCQAA